MASCWPDGLDVDIVLSTVRLIPEKSGAPIAIVYPDAATSIGVEETISLESAMLGCVLHGDPTPSSIAETLLQLYERLGLHYYGVSYVDQPTTIDGLPKPHEHRWTPESIDHHLSTNIENWKRKTDESFAIRSLLVTSAESAKLGDDFLRPDLFLELASGDPGRWVPWMLRGKGHGDLHGRNVMVGKLGTRALWPRVFDFGATRRNNLVGWDFVKLETEFKIRAYARLFTGRIENAARAIVKLEHEMLVETEHWRDANLRPAEPDPNLFGRLSGSIDDLPIARLRYLVQLIRWHASNQLGNYRNRRRFWLAEYYFLLAVYGLNSIRFENLSPNRTLRQLCLGCVCRQKI